MKKKFVFVLSASSESGDDYGPYIFETALTPEEQRAFWEEMCPGEFNVGEGPGAWGSWLHVKYEKVPIRSI